MLGDLLDDLCASENTKKKADIVCRKKNKQAKLTLSLILFFYFVEKEQASQDINIYYIPIQIYIATYIYI